uniref:Pentatricopeptide repeat-containing protein n=1 Tax=Ananas comosus var. bracteatus TaxID=296719 RepID=A0A6V7P340_ANACO|nr:unnamed protein product [Ananas comosus var. bracteatus]
MAKFGDYSITRDPLRCRPRFAIAIAIAIAASPWYSPPPFNPPPDPLILTVSRAIAAPPDVSLNTSLGSLLPSLSANLVVSLLSLNPLSLPPLALLSFFHWLSSHPHFRHTPLSFLSMANLLLTHRLPSAAAPLIRLLVARRGRDSAHALFSAALQATTPQAPHPALLAALTIEYTNADLISDAIQCIRLAIKHQLRLPFDACSYLLDRLMHSYSPAVAWAFYSEILDVGFPPTARPFNIIMHSFCKLGNLTNANLVFNEITRRGSRPTAVSFNTLIDGYCKIGDLEAGFDLKLRMVADGIEPDVFTYNVLIRAVCRVGRLDDAKQLFDEMCAKGLVPNAVTFTTLIDGHCKEGKVKAGVEFYQEMLRKGVKPDMITYNTLVNGLCKAGDLREAKKIVEEMRERGLKPDKITYTTLIDGCCKEGALEMAIELRKEMVAEGVKLDEVTYTALISG